MRKALLVGINEYSHCSLKCCHNDVDELELLLKNNENGDPNFDIAKCYDIKKKGDLKEKIKECFDGDSDVALFYFSGHGYIDNFGGYLVTPDFDKNDYGVSLQEVLLIVNGSKVKNKIVIIDSCHSGYLGENLSLNQDCSIIKDGVTILTACRKDELSEERDVHGVFTELLIEALKGGASDILGRITAASVYAYIDKNLSAWEQRPVFKTNISQFISLRDVKPRIEKEVLRRAMMYFSNKDHMIELDPSFEYTNDPKYEFKYVEPYANESNVIKFKDLQKLESVGLVSPEGEEHMYFAAMNYKKCKLTSIGKQYYKLVKNNKV